MKNIVDLSNQKILVTGASSGIGRETSILLSQLGANLVLVGRSETELLNTQSMLDRGQHMYFCCDLTQLETIEKLVAKSVAKDGAKLTGLVHAAGIGATIPLRDLSYFNMDKVMKIHYYAFVELVKQYSLKKYSKGGNIVVVSSVAAVRSGKCQTIYAAAKAAVNASVRSLAMELVKKKIRVNAVMPGLVHTNMATQWSAATTPEHIAEQTKIQLLGIGEPIDVANVIAFLLSDASCFMTGHAYCIDGGVLQ